MNIVRKVLTLAYDPKYQIYIYIYIQLKVNAEIR